MNTTDLGNIVKRAMDDFMVKHADISSGIVRDTLTVIADDWPSREKDARTLHLYLVHDCRSLAKTLSAIADAVENWDEDDERLGAGTHVEQVHTNG